VRQVAVIIGTRPEAIKLAPVIAELRAAQAVEPLVISTGQHRGLLDPILATLGIEPDHDLDVFEPGLTLDALLGRCLERLGAVLAETRPSFVLVQGDTTSTLAGAIAGLHAMIPVGHVEAGLRTEDLHLPWPEEANRRAVTRFSSLHFAPTRDAAANLLREAVSPEAIFLTGNTVVDTLLWCRENLEPSAPEVLALADDPRRVALVTLHRRESWGPPMTHVAEALADVASDYPDLLVLFPIHRNPVVRESVRKPLEGIENVRVVEPFDYPDFVQAMARASVIVTDSGGIQEEAPSLAVPVLILRDETERPDALHAGAMLVGTTRGAVSLAMRAVLDDKPRLDGVNPFGDGHAAGRVVSAIRYSWGECDRPDDFSGELQPSWA
jgi:UDP-N-acetylglucosamine 2-epimerase (non-hydrolysing)